MYIEARLQAISEIASNGCKDIKNWNATGKE